MNRYDILPLASPHAPLVSAPVASWEGDQPREAGRPRLLSLCVPAPGLTAAAFLRQARGQERFYWAEPGDGQLLAGAGVAAEVVAPPVLCDEEGPAPLPAQRFDDVAAAALALFDGVLVRSLSAAGSASGGGEARPRLFGGFAFQDDFVPDNTWSVFNPAEFVLPHYQFAQRGDDRWLTINALVDPADDLDATWRGLGEALAARLALAAEGLSQTLPTGSLHFPLSFDQWREMIQRATGVIRAGLLDKVVLARVCELQAAGPIDAAAALEYLDTAYSDSYRFLFEPRPGHAFFGATPELLVRKSGRDVETMALAGSIARGRNSEHDQALAEELLASAKDRHEHQLVVDAVRRHMAGIMEDLSVAESPSVRRLRNIQHLLTPISGTLRDPDVGIIPLVRRLHPTPALGGEPSDRALAFLRHAEPVPRGWYAGPIGWLDGAQDGVFAVAIRSAVTQHDRAWLYAGAGIVADSLPAREWAETALKFRPMLGALGAEDLV